MPVKVCGRCGAEFECKPEAIYECQCSAVRLSPVTRERLTVGYADCLCAKCLRDLEEETKDTAQPSW
ncbi:MAG: cysteine-rich CWC family protein [Candidatus Sumerlaeia bacterium]|nr:cysteine-rich CWC family protein [Candidatus Sumerlaeia bacterium]